LNNRTLDLLDCRYSFGIKVVTIFKKKIKEDLIIVYIDDILAFSKMINGLKKIKQIILEKDENMIYISKPRNASSEN
jgi:hypothetical protein